MSSPLKKVVAAVEGIIRKIFHSKNEDLPYYLVIIFAGILTIVSINAFIDLTENLAENDLEVYDESIGRFIQSFRGHLTTNFFRIITDMGDRYVYIIVVVLLSLYFIIRHNTWRFILQAVSVLLLATLTNVLLKRIINRTRPALEHLVYVDTLSYPSGHAMSAMSFYGFLAYLSARYIANKLTRYAVVFTLVLLIFLIGVSRIYLGVHYPSDVAAGFIGGFIWITFAVFVFNIIDLWVRRKERGKV